ncbi:MAG: enoyl-CoA hydratase/isomerase family protein [Cytophagales bacterium]|nr:enoyl-CoA hydratase/isomerase family protein [Cytophagales bacterium]
MQPLEYHTAERIAYLTLNRPDKRNALNAALVTALKEALQGANLDPGVKVVVLRANGKAFCAGADLETLQQLQQNTYEENLADSGHLAELFELMYTLTKPIIAQIQGHALAGGCGLAAICDFSFAVPAARFGYTEVKIGFVPAIVSAFLVRKIGEGRARELLLSGEVIPAERAQAYGLINYLVEEADLESRVNAFAHQLCTGTSGQSVAATKALLAQLPALSLSDSLKLAAQTNAHARATDDCRRGIGAFLAKEEIQW